ncbi:hypothetical protein IPO96_00905 [Candidatus Saccharibacteria bacterium]|jgi:hypothetical protein|nr:MAG: hypothetical protein IPO96_00905 [Candidatus Saccharibacteria bacterium]
MDLLSKLKNDYPNLNFEEGISYYWSPERGTVYFVGDDMQISGQWSLLHEVGHALLTHQKYSSDFELLQLEMEAWEEAVKLSKAYRVKIPNNHVQDCLDTYRDWLHARGRCPKCEAQGLQTTSKQYSCLRCGSKWQVSSAKFCRPYRRKV